MSGIVGVAPQIFEVPLIGAAQRLAITLNGVKYGLSLAYHDATNGGWTLDVADSLGNPLIAGLALVTGVDLFGQLAYLNLGGQLFVYTDGDSLAPPTYDGLGSTSHLYFIPTS